MGHRGLTFHWRIVLLPGDPGDRRPASWAMTADVSPFNCPDDVVFDRQGNLWISTDGRPGTLGSSDGLCANPASTYPSLGDGQPRPGVFHARPRRPRPPRGGHRG